LWHTLDFETARGVRAAFDAIAPNVVLQRGGLGDVDFCEKPPEAARALLNVGMTECVAASAVPAIPRALSTASTRQRV